MNQDRRGSSKPLTRGPGDRRSATLLSRDVQRSEALQDQARTREKLPAEVRRVCCAAREEGIKFKWEGSRRSTTSRGLEGVIPNFDALQGSSESQQESCEYLSSIPASSPGAPCGPESLAVNSRARTSPITRASGRRRSGSSEPECSHHAETIRPPGDEGDPRAAGFLTSVGLGYLTLDRGGDPVGRKGQRSGSRRDRSRLTGSSTSSTSPRSDSSAGQRQAAHTLRRCATGQPSSCRARRQTIRTADYVAIWVRAGAGREVVAQGTPDEIMKGRIAHRAYLSGD